MGCETGGLGEFRRVGTAHLQCPPRPSVKTVEGAHHTRIVQSRIASIGLSSNRLTDLKLRNEPNFLRGDGGKTAEFSATRVSTKPVWEATKRKNIRNRTPTFTFIKQNRTGEATQAKPLDSCGHNLPPPVTTFSQKPKSRVSPRIA